MAKQYIINVYPRTNIYEHHEFIATFDGYDGAPIDHETPSDDVIGGGETEMAAILDLVEQSL